MTHINQIKQIQTEPEQAELAGTDLKHEISDKTETLTVTERLLFSAEDQANGRRVKLNSEEKATEIS